MFWKELKKSVFFAYSEDEAHIAYGKSGFVPNGL